MHVPSGAILALGEGGAHLCAGVGGIELHLRPLLVDSGTKQVKLQILVAQPLAYSYYLLYTALAVVYSVLLRVLNKP